jgi:hypothetical protein
VSTPNPRCAGLHTLRNAAQITQVVGGEIRIFADVRQQQPTPCWTERTSVSASRRRRLANSTQNANAMKTSETLKPPPPPVAGHATESPTPTTPAAVPQAEPTSAEVVITEQQVMFGTAVTAASRPKNRLMAALGRVFATSTTQTRSPRQHDVPRRMYYIEGARMGREMDRL